MEDLRNTIGYMLEMEAINSGNDCNDCNRKPALCKGNPNNYPCCLHDVDKGINKTDTYENKTKQ